MLKRKKEIIAKVMATTMLASTLTSTFTTNVSAAEPQTKATVSETTIAGDDRYKTAVEISKNYSSTSKHAVIVNGQKGIVDALTATPYASLKKAPILMTQSTKLNEDTKKELTRRGVKTVDIVGGVNSVSDAVKAEIEAMGITVNRIAGNSKYETALKVAKEIDAISDISKIAVTNGEVLADAVSVAAPAAQNKMPIILAHPTKGLDAEVKKYIDGEGISTSYVIGGTSSVSTTTQNSLPGTKKRLEGTDRQGTNASVIKEFYTSSSYDNMYVAKSGQVNKSDEIADALAVGVLAASNQDPVMLVGKNLGSTQKTLLESKDLEKITKVGGNIPTASIDAIKNTQSSTKTVTTVAELKTALANAKDGDIINFNPSGTVSEAVSLSTTKNVTVNLNGTHSGAVSVDMANGTLNINGNVSNKVSVDAVKSINVSSGKTVKELVLNSGAKSAILTNKGTITTATVSSTGVTVTNSGTITTLNPNGDTTINNTGTIGNMDASNVVASISSLNAKQVVIRFNKSIDKNSIIDSSNETLVDGTVRFNVAIPEVTGSKTNVVTANSCNAELSENGLTLTITAPENQYFKGNYSVEIDNIASNGIEQDKYTGTLNVDDKIAPTVSSVKFDASTDKFEVTLSEPINVSERANIVLNLKGNINVPNTDIAWNTIGDKIEFTRPTGVTIGSSVSVYIDGLKDIVGNTMSPYTTNISVQNTTLSYTVTQELDNKIKVTFNKDLKTALTTSNVTAHSAATVVNPVAINSITPIDAKTYEIDLGTVNYDSNNRKSFELQIKAGITDVTDVTTTAVMKKSITLVKDTTAPTVSSVKAKTGNTGLEVTLSEEVENLIPSKVKLYKGDGVSIPVSSVAIDGTNKKLVTVNTSSALQDGTYQVKFEAGAVKDLNTNYNKLMETSKITIKNAVSNDYKITGITSIPGSNVFDVTYTGNIDDENISYKNFMLNNKEIHSASTIEVNNTSATVGTIPAKTIRVSLALEDSVTITGKATFKATGLKLKSGKVLDDKSDVFSVKDNTAPTLTGAELKTTSNKLILTFDENIQVASSTSLSDILGAIKITTGTSNVEYTGGSDIATVVVADGNQLVITVTPSGDDSAWNKVVKVASSIKVSVRDGQSIIKDNDDNNARKIDNKVVTKNNK